MTRDEDGQFRITAWPSGFAAPGRVAVPRLVAVASCSAQARAAANCWPRFLGRPATGSVPRGSAGLGDADGDAQDFTVVAASEFHDLWGAEGFSHLAERAARFDSESGGPPGILIFSRDLIIRDLPGELFLREMLDLEPLEFSSLFAFVARWGVLSMPSHPLWFDDVAVRSMNSDEPLQAGTAIASSTAGTQDATGEHIQELYEAYGSHLSRTDYECDGEEFAFGSSSILDEYVTIGGRQYTMRTQSFIARAYQATIECWLEVNQLSTSNLAEKLPWRLREAWSKRGLPVPRDGIELLSTLCSLTNLPASAYGPRVEIMGATKAQLLSGPVAPKIVTAMCLQLIAFIDRDVPVRTCANDNCQRLFAFQRGRAEFGQYRSRGVKFCSDSCAQNQAQRNYRRRKHAAAGPSGG